MSDETATDLFYKFVGRIEAKRRWLPMLVFIYLSLALIGLFMNGMGFMILAHQKSAVLDMNMLITYLNIVICSIFMVAGANQYLVLRSYQSKLRNIRALEETIYDEVLRSGDSLSED